MASQVRRIGADLARELREEAWSFPFHQAVRLVSLGEGRPVTRSARESSLRFRTRPDLAFPASEVVSLREADPGGGQEMVVAIPGLTGVSGVLPYPYTEFVLERLGRHDGAAHAFFDLFTHRALCLLHEAWTSRRLHMACEEPGGRRLSRYLLCFAGLDGCAAAQGSEGEKQVPGPGFLATFAGLLGRRPLPAGTLTVLARELLGVPVALEPFAAQRLALGPGERCVLDGRGCRLGKGAVLGERVWTRQTKVRLRLGPLGWQEYRALLPGSSGARALAGLAAVCLGQALCCEASLRISRDQVPEPMLGRTRLGLDTWVRTRDVAEDREDLRYSLLA